MTKPRAIHTGQSGDDPETWNKKNIVERFVREALDQGLLAVVDDTRGEFAEQSKRRIAAWRTAFPDFSTTIEQLLADGDWVAFRLKHRGTHRGEFLGVVPTGHQVEFTSLVFNRVKDRVVVENWGLHDNETLLKQLTSS
jgi:predicted ester cyclase